MRLQRGQLPINKPCRGYILTPRVVWVSRPPLSPPTLLLLASWQRLVGDANRSRAAKITSPMVALTATFLVA